MQSVESFCQTAFTRAFRRKANDGSILDRAHKKGDDRQDKEDGERNMGD